MPFVVLYDANVLYPNALRDLLVRLAQGPRAFVQAKWTDEILDEVFRALLRNRPDLDPAKLARTRTLMNRIEAKDADTFVLDQICLGRSRVYSRVQQIADSRSHPQCTVEDVLRELERNGLLQSAAALRA